MGGLLSHSSNRSEKTKTKWRRGKRKRHDPLETATEVEEYDLQNSKQDKNSPINNLTNTYDDWNKRNDLQLFSNITVDPPGAPSSYPPNYSSRPIDIMTQSWSASHDANNSLYQITSHSIPVASTSYDHRQHSYSQVPNTFFSQSQPQPHMVLEERPSKKVQFAPTHHQITNPKQQLTATHSWHETSTTMNPNSTSIIKRDGSPFKVTHRPRGSPSDTPPSIAQKAVYVGIDHQATLAGRGQTTAENHVHKSTNKSNVESSISNINSQRARPHTHHHQQQHRKQDSSDSSSLKATISAAKSLETLQPRLSGSNRPLTTTSTSTNRQIQHTESRPPIENDIKQLKTPNNNQHRQHRQPQQQQQQRNIATRHESPIRNEVSLRRVELKQQSPSPLIPTPSHRRTHHNKSKKPSVSFASPTTTARINRTRV